MSLSDVDVLPLELKGHLLELAAAVAEDDAFKPYTSAATQRTYSGGKPERELEEVEETVSEFIALSSS